MITDKIDFIESAFIEFVYDKQSTSEKSLQLYLFMNLLTHSSHYNIGLDCRIFCYTKYLLIFCLTNKAVILEE